MNCPHCQRFLPASPTGMELMRGVDTGVKTATEAHEISTSSFQCCGANASPCRSFKESCHHPANYPDAEETRKAFDQLLGACPACDRPRAEGSCGEDCEMDSHGAAWDDGVSPIPPGPVRELGAHLSRLLQDDAWNSVEPLLLDVQRAFELHQRGKNEPLRWSKDKPSIPGWYWLRRPIFKSPECVKVVYFDRGWNDDEEWAGPVSPPPEPHRICGEPK